MSIHTDFLADMFSRLQVGYIARKKTVRIKYTKFNYCVLYLLYREGLFDGVHVIEEDLVVQLRYAKGSPLFRKLKKFSVISNRKFLTKKKLFFFVKNFRFGVISTPLGLVTFAQFLNLYHLQSFNIPGGEVILIILT